MKKIMTVTMMLMLMLTGLVGCGKDAEEPAPAEQADTKTYTVGICQLVQHDALDKATQGFKDALTEKLGDKVTFNEQNASGEIPVCTTIANQLVAENVDLILANATQALQACANATTTIPILGTSVTDFGLALSIDMAQDGVTGINVSGTNDQAPFDEQANQIVELFPDAAKVGILYCSSESNSKYQADAMRTLLADKGLEAQDFTFTDSNDIQAVVKAAVDYADVIWIPTDNQVASNGGVVENVASAAKVPIIASEEGICRSTGAVATLSISYYEIGHQAGEMAYEILVNGADPATMNVQNPRSVTLKYNPEVAEAYGVTIPEGYEALE